MSSVQALFRNNVSLVDPRRVTTQSSMTRFDCSNDPVAEFEKEELSNYTRIDNTGRGVIRCRNPDWEINDLYKSSEGHGHSGSDHEYSNTSYKSHFFADLMEDAIAENMGLSTNHVLGYYELNSGYNYGDSVYANGRHYTEVLGEDGELAYYDLSEGDGGFNMCVNPKSLNLAASTPLTGMDAMNALSSPDFNINYKVAANGDVVPKTNFEKSMDAVDASVSPQNLSASVDTLAVQAAATTSQTTTAFNSASTSTGTVNTQQNSVVFRKDLTPIEQAALEITRTRITTAETTSPALTNTSLPAANADSFRVTGTQGPSV